MIHQLYKKQRVVCIVSNNIKACPNGSFLLHAQLDLPVSNYITLSWIEIIPRLRMVQYASTVLLGFHVLGGWRACFRLFGTCTIALIYQTLEPHSKLTKPLIKGPICGTKYEVGKKWHYKSSSTWLPANLWYQVNSLIIREVSSLQCNRVVWEGRRTNIP